VNEACCGIVGEKVRVDKNELSVPPDDVSLHVRTRVCGRGGRGGVGYWFEFGDRLACVALFIQRS